MAKVEVTGLPEGTTIVQGYFVWSGFGEEGERRSGGVEYPFDEDGSENHDYDGLKVLGMLTIARARILESELHGEPSDEED